MPNLRGVFLCSTPTVICTKLFLYKLVSYLDEFSEVARRSNDITKALVRKTDTNTLTSSPIVYESTANVSKLNVPVVMSPMRLVGNDTTGTLNEVVVRQTFPPILNRRSTVQRGCSF